MSVRVHWDVQLWLWKGVSQNEAVDNFISISLVRPDAGTESRPCASSKVANCDYKGFIDRSWQSDTLSKLIIRARGSFLEAFVEEALPDS